MPQVKVELGKRSYPVIIGTKLNDKLIAQLKKQVDANRLFVFYDSRFYALHGQKLNRLLKKNFKLIEFTIPSGEKSKSPKVVNQLHDFLLSEKISRTDFILACGGGVISDLVGYTAATVLRGVKWGIVSTTLLGMVDASIGGKTGVNAPAGKNLIGAFWQPSFVIADTDYLNTLPAREIICGMGEIVKYAGLCGKPVADLLSEFIESGYELDSKLLNKLIYQCAKFKAEIVSRDETEGKTRMFLNLGHTVGHALEKSQGYGKLLHGEAVILGLLAMVELSLDRQGSAKNSLNDYKSMITGFLPLLPKYRFDLNQVIKSADTDKKRQSGRQNFVLLKRVGQPIIVNDIRRQQLKSAVTGMLKIYREDGN